MPKKITKINLNADEIKQLNSIVKSRTTQAQFVQRAKILLLKNDGMINDAIADKLDINRHSVELCLKKYVNSGVDAALNDLERSGRPQDISDEENAWIINIACQKPTDYGYAQELWTITSLHNHIRKISVESGYPRLASIARSTVHLILSEADIKPFKIKYYLEKRDPEFDAKMHDVLLVYKQVELQFDAEGNLIPQDEFCTVTISYDEKPGIQAIANTCDDLQPTTEHGFIGRDSEYKRLGTLSFLAGMDLLTGEIIPLVSDTHKSMDFIQFLKILNNKYPKGDKIRIILDNHSAHTSKETQQYLNNVPGRFEFIFTPKHGSWLNLIESFFSKMTKQMLRGIRVKSKDELIERIYKYINEINTEPVVYRWKYKMDEISTDELYN